MQWDDTPTRPASASGPYENLVDLLYVDSTYVRTRAGRHNSRLALLRGTMVSSFGWHDKYFEYFRWRYNQCKTLKERGKRRKTETFCWTRTHNLRLYQHNALTNWDTQFTSEWKWLTHPTVLLPYLGPLVVLLCVSEIWYYFLKSDIETYHLKFTKSSNAKYYFS